MKFPPESLFASPGLETILSLINPRKSNYWATRWSGVCAFLSELISVCARGCNYKSKLDANQIKTQMLTQSRRAAAVKVNFAFDVSCAGTKWSYQKYIMYRMHIYKSERYKIDGGTFSWHCRINKFMCCAAKNWPPPYIQPAGSFSLSFHRSGNEKCQSSLLMKPQNSAATLSSSNACGGGESAQMRFWTHPTRTKNRRRLGNGPGAAVVCFF